MHLSPVPSFLPALAQFNQSTGVFLHTIAGKMKQQLLNHYWGFDHSCWFTCELEQHDANTLQMLPFQTSAVPNRADEMRHSGWLPHLNRKGADPHSDCKQIWWVQILCWAKLDIRMSNVSTGSRMSHPGVSTVSLCLPASLGHSTFTSWDLYSITAEGR